MNDDQRMDLLRSSHMWTHENEDSYINPPMEDHDIDHFIDINPHAPRARNNDNLYKDIYGDPIQPNPTDNALDPAQPVKLPGIETILNPIRRATDANFPYQTPQSDAIELNNSCMQLPLPEDWACYAHGIYSSERLTNAGGREINPLCDEPEQCRYPNIPGPEVLNTHDSTNYDQDTEMQNAPQQGDVQVVAHGELASMQGSLPNGLSPSISNQNLTIEQQPTSPKYGRHLQSGGPRLIKVITDEEIDGLRKLKAKEDRERRTENPDPEHKKDVRKANSKAHRERNSNEIEELNSMKQRLEGSIKIRESSRVKAINLYNEIQKKATSKMVWSKSTLSNISSQFDSTLEGRTKWIIARINSFLSNNTRLFIHDYLSSDERDINNQIELESEEKLLNDLESIKEDRKQLNIAKKKFKKEMEEQKLCPSMRRIIEEIIDQMAKDLKKKKDQKWNMDITHAEYIHFVRKSQSLQKSLIRANLNINMMKSELKLLSQEKQYKLDGDKLSSRTHRTKEALKRIRLRNENKRLKNKDGKIGKDLIEIGDYCRSLSIDADDVLREGIDCINGWVHQYQITNRSLSQNADIEFNRHEIHEFLELMSIWCKS